MGVNNQSINQHLFINLYSIDVYRRIMASVSSLDQDMRALRLSRYTPAAAAELRAWIESTLHSPLPAGDLLAALKDGVALCQLANLVLPPPGLKFKKSNMPFIQMENISHFLKACEMPPLNMPAHDRFLTVDLFEAKDPAQVLQCLGAFSRQAHNLAPAKFPSAIGGKKNNGVVSPTSTGNNPASWQRGSTYGRPSSPTKSAARPMSPALTGGSNGSQNSGKSHGPVSSWSSRKDEGASTPAWNIHQYGYMGGASQGNQGISFGARRQITSQAPSVPSLAEKERVRKTKEVEDAKVETQRRQGREAEEERDRVAEEQRWEDETRRQREDERRRLDEQKRQWEAQEQRWKLEEEARRKEEIEIQAKLNPKKAPDRPRVSSSSVLRGQNLSDYQRELESSSTEKALPETPEQRRVKELEKQLEEARERERAYQLEREERLKSGSLSANGSRPGTAQTETSWVGDEREVLRGGPWQPSTPGAARAQQTRPLPQPTVEEPALSDQDEEDAQPELPTRSLQPSLSANSITQLNPASAPTSSPLGSSSRPLPTPNKEYAAWLPESPAEKAPSQSPAFVSSRKQPPTTTTTLSQERGATSFPLYTSPIPSTTPTQPKPFSPTPKPPNILFQSTPACTGGARGGGSEDPPPRPPLSKD